MTALPDLLDSIAIAASLAASLALLLTTLYSGIARRDGHSPRACGTTGCGNCRTGTRQSQFR